MKANLCRTEVPVLWPKEAQDIPMAISVVNAIKKKVIRKGRVVKIFDNHEELISQTSVNRAIIIIGTESSQMMSILRALSIAEIQSVITTMDIDHIGSHYYCATFSRRTATEQLLDFLMGKGCRSFAMLGCGNRSANDLIHCSAMEVYSKRDTQINCQYFFYHDKIEESFEAFFMKYSEFDAVLCPNDFVAVAFLSYCEKKGLSVPEDFLLASFKDTLLSRCCQPSLTTMSVDYNAIGESAVMLWFYLQDAHTKKNKMRITVPSIVVERETTNRNIVVSQLESKLPFGEITYQGGPFYSEPIMKNLMLIERCLQRCDPLDFRIIDRLIKMQKYESICEELFLSESTLQYRVRQIFLEAHVPNRDAFLKLITSCFPLNSNFEKEGKVKEMER